MVTKGIDATSPPTGIPVGDHFACVPNSVILKDSDTDGFAFRSTLQTCSGLPTYVPHTKWRTCLVLDQVVSLTKQSKHVFVSPGRDVLYPVLLTPQTRKTEDGRYAVRVDSSSREKAFARQAVSLGMASV